jgi:hypothetical protein
MKVYYPALTTGAIFASLLVLDIIRRQSKVFIGHLIFGAIAIMLMVYLSQNDAEFVAWGIFLVPFVILLIGFLIGYFNAAPGTTTTVIAPVVAPVAPTDSCKPATPTPAPPSCIPKDVSGNDVTTAPVVVPPTPVKACGPNSGKTQCVDTRSLQSA